MTITDILQDTRVAHVRDLKLEITRLRQSLDDARRIQAAWEHHFALALALVRDSERFPARLWLIDGWNVVYKGLKDQPAPRDLAERKAFLTDLVRSFASKDPRALFNLIFDGPAAHAASEANFRVSHTGGTGRHRADRLMLDYLSVRALTGARIPVTIVSEDQDLCQSARRNGADVLAPKDFIHDFTNR